MVTLVGYKVDGWGLRSFLYDGTYSIVSSNPQGPRDLPSLLSSWLLGPPVAQYVFLTSRTKGYNHTKKPPQAIGHRAKHQPYVLRWAQILKARR